MFEIFFSPEMFKLIQKETNQYATQQINKKEASGPLDTQTCMCTVEYSLITRNKKNFDNHAHKHVTQVIFVKFLEFASDYLYSMQLLLECLWIGSSRY
jgi:hypothetical protein